MKKIFIGIICLLSPFFVYASENDTKLTYNNLYDYNYEIKGDGIYLSNHTTMFYANGKVAYCIEPGVSINTSTYNSSSSFANTNFSKKQSEYLELLGYFGYEYPSHKTIKYYLASQELMWEYIKNVEVRYTAQQNGKEIDLSKEKNEILTLIKNYQKNPSFENVLSINVENKIKDVNNVLKDYEILNNEKGAKIEGNNLIIRSNKEEDISLTLKYKKYTNETTLVYTKSGSQTLATLRLSSDKKVNIDFSFKSGKVSINKTGEKISYDSKYVYEMSNLEGATFGLYDLSDNLIQEISTDENGNGYIENLSFGSYYLKEIKNKTGHIVDENKYYFDIDKNNLEKNFSFENYLEKGNVKIIKKGNDGKLLNDVYFDLYKDNIYLGTFKTENGIFYLNDLAYGDYYLKEIKTNDGYLIDEDGYYFSLSDKTLEINLLNYLIIDVPITYKDNFLLIFLKKIIEIII